MIGKRMLINRFIPRRYYIFLPQDEDEDYRMFFSVIVYSFLVIFLLLLVFSVSVS